VRLIMRLMYVSSTICLLARESKAQGQQLWLDYQVDYPFQNDYLLQLGGSYQSSIGAENKWRNLMLTPTFEWGPFQFLDFIATAPMSFTVQSEDYNSFEVDPALGVRYHVTQNRRITSRLIFKFEERVLRDLENEDWQTSTRLRLKGEIFVSLNGPNLYQDNLWWTILDYEVFYVTDEQLDERYANRQRGRIGLGYRLNYKNRFEVLYTLQSSKDEIYGELHRLDNVIQLRYKMYLHAFKKTK
jgi:hypothetical protein